MTENQKTLAMLAAAAASGGLFLYFRNLREIVDQHHRHIQKLRLEATGRRHAELIANKRTRKQRSAPGILE